MVEREGEELFWGLGMACMVVDNSVLAVASGMNPACFVRTFVFGFLLQFEV